MNFYPVIRFLVTPLLVTRYCVTLFSNTRTGGRSLRNPDRTGQYTITTGIKIKRPTDLYSIDKTMNK